MYLPVLLWFLPLLAINFGYGFLTSIDLYWQKHEQKEIAQQEVEALSAGADFSYQFARMAGSFVDAFKGSVNAEFKEQQFKDFITRRSEKIFRRPFPDYELFTFRIPEGGGNPDMLFMHTETRPSKRAFCRAFEHLVKVNRGDPVSGDLSRQNEAIISSILGGESKADVMAKSQRGKPSFAFYRFFPHWFIWEYFEIKGKGTFGFFLFTRSEETTHFAGKLLALRDLREQKVGLGVFVPLFSGYGGSVYQAPLHKSKILRSWVKERVSLVENDLKSWLEDGAPPVSQLGNFQAFSYLGKGQTHLTVLLMPLIKVPDRPLWLFFGNIFGAGMLLLLLVRGLLLGVWPVVNLKLRFIMTYLLAATLPISLLIISAYGYVAQYRRAIHFQAVSRLQFCIKQFDARKAQILDEYKAAFAEIFTDEALNKILKEKGGASQEAQERILSIFRDRPQPLPLLSFAIMDEVGKGARYYGGHSQSEADPGIEAFEYPIVTVLRKKILEFDPAAKLRPFKPNNAQITSSEAYKSMTGNHLSDEVDKRRSFAVTRQMGATTATQMHELIKIDGCDRFAIFVVWDDQALDVKTFKHSVDYFGLNNSGFVFMAYRVTPQGLVYLNEPDRHTGAEFLEKSRSLAELASFRDSYAGARYDNLSVVAMPSKKYYQTIIVGGTQHFELERSVSNRLMVLALILLLALIVVFWCSYLSARIFLDPITGLKSALDKVAAGQLDIEMTSSSSDELGSLCREFANMTRGLREREKLATLISDHAIEAISRSGQDSGVPGTDSFSGVALVSDIRNFTGMCEEYAPDMITDLLNEHFAQMTRIISENGGRIYKYIGDAIEAVFPEDDHHGESAAERAFNAASLMIIRLKQINRLRSKNKLFNYRIGIGLAYGKMHAGTIGNVETRLDYAIIGDPIKSAAILESASVRNPAYPLVLDATITERLQNSGLIFEKIKEFEGPAAYILAELGGLSDIEPGSNSVSHQADRNSQLDSGSVDLGSRHYDTGSGSGLSPFNAFVLGALFITLILAGIIWGTFIMKDAQKQSLKIEAASGNLRLIEQMKSENAVQIAFENNCRSLLVDFEQRLNAGNDAGSLQESFAARIASISLDEGRPARSAVFVFGNSGSRAKIPQNTKLVVKKGFSESALKNLAELFELKRVIDVRDWDKGPNSIPDSFSREVFGDQVTNSVLLLEFPGRAAEVVIDGRAEYFFYDYLMGPDEERKGIFALSVPISQIKNSLPLLINGYADDDVSLALVDQKKQWLFSRNFPAELKSDADLKGAVTGSEEFVVNDDSLNLAGAPFRVLVARQTDVRQMKSVNIVAAVALIISGFLLFFWFKVVTGTSIVNSSIAAKLWLALLVSAVTPMITLFFVFGLYANEDYNARVSQEKGELQRFIDLFELRDSFANPLGWKMVNDCTKSKETMVLADALNKASDTVEVTALKADLKALMDSWHEQQSQLDENVINFAPRDIAIAGKSGWDFASSGKDTDEVTEFGLMLKQIAKSLVNRRIQSPGQIKIQSDSLKGEMVVETGLQIVRSLFGDDVYIKLSHGVGLPVLMNVLSGTAGIIIHPVPSIEKPEFIMVWMMMFEYEGYLARVARNYKGSYKVFPVEMHRYGNLVKTGNSKLRQTLTRSAAWISSSNLPISQRNVFEGEPYLVEGRPGITQITSLIVAMAPEKPILEAIRQSSMIFYTLLILSLLMILAIARNVAADILEPVTSLMTGMKQAGRENFAYRLDFARSDELGALCSSFDRMMKGLEEKKLMGRMLSKTAQKVTLQEHASESRKADCVFIYIGIPTFSSWISGISTEQLFADLKSHVAQIARIIMDEGGDIDKIIGDKLLAVFHADHDHRSAVAAACRAAIGIINAENRSMLPFPVAIGINLGTVITGFLGVGEKRDFTVIGDAVNVTARIEGLAESLRFQRCLVSQKVFELVSRDFTAREFGEVELKGKSLPLKVYQLTI